MGILWDFYGILLVNIKGDTWDIFRWGQNGVCIVKTNFAVFDQQELYGFSVDLYGIFWDYQQELDSKQQINHYSVSQERAAKEPWLYHVVFILPNGLAKELRIEFSNLQMMVYEVHFSHKSPFWQSDANDTTS